MSVVVMLAWLWWGLCGFIAAFMGFWAFGSMLYQPQEDNVKNRDKWLRQHFGEAGMKRWKENHRKTFLLKKFEDTVKRTWDAKHNKAENDFWAKMGGRARRTADGRCEGFVPVDIKKYYDSVPWSNDGSEYCETHATGIPGMVYYYSEVSCQSNWKSHHGEPRSSDWFAAGFWDPVARPDDGVIVDPMKLFEDEVEDAIWKGHKRPDFIRMPDGMYERAFKACRDLEKKTGRRAPGIGMR